MIVVPFISHSARSPLSLRQRMSVRASPLKSPISTTCQLAPGATGVPDEVIAPLPTMSDPSISQAASEPELESRHRTSELPSASKSPMPATLQVEPGLGVAPPGKTVTSALPVTVEPFRTHIATSPVALLRQSTSDLPLRSKSPMPATLQFASGCTATPPETTSPLLATVEPFMNQAATSPVAVLRHKRS